MNYLISLFLGASLLFALPCYARWKLIDESSVISFVSVKNGNHVETHRFDKLLGNVADDGQVTVTIPLASVNTNIPIRDERIREFLFATDKYPDAVITSKVDMSGITALKPGESIEMSIGLSLELKKNLQSFTTLANITLLKNGNLQVNQISPVLLDTSKFHMEEGIETLKTLAGLEEILSVVPIHYKLVFEREKPAAQTPLTPPLAKKS